MYFHIIVNICIYVYFWVRVHGHLYVYILRCTKTICRGTNQTCTYMYKSNMHIPSPHTHCKQCKTEGSYVLILSGCPSETIECIGKKGVCAISTEECTTRVGCAPPLKNCGVQRDPNTGKPVWATDGTAAKMICAASCPEGDSHDRKPKLHTSKVDGGKKDQRIEAMDSLNKIAMRLKTLKDGAFTGPFPLLHVLYVCKHTHLPWHLRKIINLETIWLLDCTDLWFGLAHLQKPHVHTYTHAH